jgi:hypothetical protein
VNRPLALDALTLIKDPGLRAKAFEHVTGIWARDDSAAAIAFVEQSAALSPAQKEALVGKLRAQAAGKKQPAPN